MATRSTSTKCDEEVRADVSCELRWDARLRGLNLDVDARDGVLTLTGTVDSESARAAAEEAARRVGRGYDVVNSIDVKVPETSERSDAEIIRAVRGALKWDVRIPEESIRSTVVAGHVKLQGVVDYPSQREHAEEAVRDLAGVRAVTNAITVTTARVTSSDVRRSIAEAVSRHAQLDPARIEIAVEDSRVTLSGVVHSCAEREAVLRAARGTLGVRSVDNKLQLEPARTTNTVHHPR